MPIQPSLRPFSVFYALCTVACMPPEDDEREDAEFRAATIPPHIPDHTFDLSECPIDPPPRTIHIMEANRDVDQQQHDDALATLFRELSKANTTILLGPDVVLDFSVAPTRQVPILFAECTTLASVEEPRPGAAGPGPLSARTPRSLGPRLEFPPRTDGKYVLLEVNCEPDPNDAVPNDHVRISGLRLFGPSFGDQGTFEKGIYIRKCRDIEVSNMEVAGWGGQGIQVEDEDLPGDTFGRIEQPSDVRIFGNYIHHNQHQTDGGAAAGYGVSVNHGAFAEISANVFDFNRHAIAGAGDMGGYDAWNNLVLKGGGVHGVYFGEIVYTHQFDIHGDEKGGKGGQAGETTLFAYNSFQFINDAAISVRGTPSDSVRIRDNVFPHEALEDDWGEDAIWLYDHSDLGETVFIGPNNIIDHDSYGQYGVCDFDGDQRDDLFLATGQTWWFSSGGEFQWTYLATRTETLDELELVYFDGDTRCDVLAEGGGGQWVVSSGGVDWWEGIGDFDAPLDEVVFGRFDPSIVDTTPGTTKQTTHALHRKSNGEWHVTPLSPGPAWNYVGGSNYPMDDLAFGDFTGDGVTDVLAVEGGEWSISNAAHDEWETLNADLDDDVGDLLIEDIGGNNIDDILRIERTEEDDTETIIVWISDDGVTPWRELAEFTFSYSAWADVDALPLFAFAGRFGAAPGGAALVVDRDRTGYFSQGASEWTARFPY